LIIANIVGGLGNQLFQFSASFALSYRSGEEIRFDTTTYQNPKYYNPEGFLLNRLFYVDVTEASLIDYFVVLKAAAPFTRVKHRLSPEMFSSNFWRERDLFTPDARFFPPYNFRHAYLYGWWQSELYFKDLEVELRAALRFKVSELTSEALALAGTIRGQLSVSVHVRRGDYVTNPTYSKIYGTCSLTYYERSINIIRDLYPEAVFYIFSDDRAWVMSQDLFHNHHIVKTCEKHGSWNDMYLMSQCCHHIIANSSFSWWGAWLNEKSNKTIIAPDMWFADKTSTPHLLPKQWIKVKG